MKKALDGVARKFRYPLILVLILFGFITITGTGGGSGSGSGSGGGLIELFLAAHLNEEGRMGDGAFISLFRVAGDQCAFETVDEVYVPHNGTDSHASGRGDLVAIGLHGDFNPRNTSASQEMRSAKAVGAWFYAGDSGVQDLPFSPSPVEGRYTAISGSSIQASPSGHVFYRTTNKSDYYFTDDEYFFVARFNPVSGTAEHTDPAVRDAFLGAQPETSDYYGNIWAVIANTIYASDCGRYVYGAIRPRSYYSGMWYNAGPWYLFEYDFETAAFRRLGDEEDSGDHTLVGITKDSRYLVYRHAGVTKRLDMETGQIATLNNAPTLSGTSRTAWNNRGIAYGGLNFYDIFSDEIRELARQNIEGAPQMSSDGAVIFFLARADGIPHLYEMSRFLSENPAIKVLCRLPSNVQGVKIIWSAP